MLKFVERCCTKLIHVLVDGFYRTVHMLLTAARILNGICHLIAALFLLIFALVLVHDMGDRVPAANVGAFLIAWLGVALAIAGLEQLARTEPRNTVTTARPFLLENRAIEDRKAVVLSMLRRRDATES